MPKNLNIFAGPGQVALYDAVRGYAFLGFADIRLTEKAYTHQNISGDLIRYDRIFSLKITLPLAGEEILSDLEARIGESQKVYIVGLETAFVIDAVKLIYEIQRSWSGETVHKIELQGQWKDPDNHRLAVNLLSLNPDIEISMESFSGGIAEGWNAQYYDVIGQDSTSFRSGSAQSIVWIGAPTGQVFCSDYFTLAFDKRVKITASIYLRKISGSGQADVKLGFVLKYTDNTTESFYGIIENNLLSTSGSRLSYSKVLSPIKAVKEICFSLYFEDDQSLTVELDDAQLELGSLSEFREN